MLERVTLVLVPVVQAVGGAHHKLLRLTIRLSQAIVPKVVCGSA